MSIKIAVFNQKGGTAKTTSTINIAGILVKEYGKQVLIIDGDPQANSTKTLLMENGWDEEHEYTVVDVLENKIDINKVIKPALIRTRTNALPKELGIDVLPTKRGMGAIEIESVYDIKDHVDKISKDYDFIIYDCPPYLSEFSISILAAVDWVLVPATVDKDSLDGYGELLDTINMLKVKNYNKDIKILGIYLTMINPNESFDKYIYNSCLENFGGQFINVTVRRNTIAKQASFFGTPLCWFKPTAKVTNDYKELVKEILERLNIR